MPELGSANPARRLGRVLASPRARRAMAQLGIEAGLVRGTGPNHRITHADVMKASVPPSSPGAAAAQPMLSEKRRIIAERTSQSVRTVPQFQMRTEVDATALVEFRQKHLPARAGVRPSITDLLLKALALGLRGFPQANRIWDNGGIIDLPTVAVGLVIALDDGLVLPVMAQANQLGIYELTRQRIELTSAARTGHLQPTIPRAAASSLSNLGQSCVDEFTGLIAPPQSTLLAVGRMALRPFVKDGSLVACQTLKLCLTVDHRVLDGAPGAAFLGQIAAALENPHALVS